MTSPPLQLGGKYEILAKLGEGGMGAIYKVRHRLLDEVRVIKAMRPSLAEDEQSRERFLREAKASIRLRHHNIAQLYDFSVDKDGTTYIVMEFIAGLTLAQLQKRWLPTIPVALEIGIQALRALDYLHSKQFVHRDIAPDNLMVTRESDGRPTVKLIDLGIAKSLEGDHTLTQKGMFVGKMRYASPEQFGGAGGAGVVEARSDLYSFGIVFYELLTGRFPIVGDDYGTLLSGHLFRPPLPFAESDPEGRVPLLLRTAVLRALEKEPSARFASAGELAGVLVRLQSEWAAQHGSADSTLPAELFDDLTHDAVRPGSTQERLDMEFPDRDASEGATRRHTRARSASGASARATVDDLVDQAWKLIVDQQGAAARDLLERARELIPEDPEVHRLLGEVQNLESRRQEEERRATQVSAASRTILRLIEGERLEDAQRELDKAERELRAPAELQPLRLRLDLLTKRRARQQTERLLEEAREKLAGGDLDEAERLVRSAPDDTLHGGAGSELLARIANARRERDQALQVEQTRLQEQVRQQSESEQRRTRVLSMVAEGRSLLERGRLQEAMATAQKALAADSELPDCWRLIDEIEEAASRQRDSERRQKAERSLQEVRRLAAAGDLAAARRALSEVWSQLAETPPGDLLTALEQAGRELDLAEEAAARASRAGGGDDHERTLRLGPTDNVYRSGSATPPPPVASPPPASPAPPVQPVSWTGYPASPPTPAGEWSEPPPSRWAALSQRLGWKLPAMLGAGAGLLILAVAALVAFLGGGPGPQGGPAVPTPTTGEQPVSGTPGRVELVALPWATLDGIQDAAGNAVPLPAEPTTPALLELKPGKYVVSLSHPAGGAQKVELEVTPGGVVRKVVDMHAMDADRYFASQGLPAPR